MDRRVVVEDIVLAIIFYILSFANAYAGLGEATRGHVLSGSVNLFMALITSAFAALFLVDALLRWLRGDAP